ncbi:MAG: AbrB/MazE/SpoVT family DNA-binding domain-containing protein [Imperialibacter sp.]|uniref:AbrB/MazE/SpoVT family DNA-binding domain-containing protein n=1 Tax=unclassified Imperialibacter TaxID=2629706 RepID=UPI00125B7491|nr:MULTISPECIES: AbrB/MazE/SpoVT family DNA-binding domain-containing protein [unclassified Imperialibacter]CAD5270687.1 putative addiction module antidote [Imperialibacter sp. 89]CAD5298364.1 putative addiction module antidote [Imperialibacter sp. 75]VVT34883.1 putative addiction module antidote [Imperialibacter sp. EC-SDR9]
MMVKSKVTTVGSSAGIILPKEIMARLHVEKGDTVTFIETPTGIEITAYNPEFDEEMTHARKVMGDYRNALKKLAE